jgi:hypothetical protein
VSFWYLIIYATMFLGNQYNKNHYFLSAKLFVSMGLVAWFMKTGWILQSIFDFLRAVAFVNWVSLFPPVLSSCPPLADPSH